MHALNQNEKENPIRVVQQYLNSYEDAIIKYYSKSK